MACSWQRLRLRLDEHGRDSQPAGPTATAVTFAAACSDILATAAVTFAAATAAAVAAAAAPAIALAAAAILILHLRHRLRCPQR